MGSSFSYSDIAPPHFRDFKHKLLREEKCQKDASVSCFVIESTPINDSIKNRTGYSKSVQWINSTNYVPLQGEYYGTDGELLKTMWASDIKEIDTKAHKWIAHFVRQDEVRTKRFTEFKFNKIEVLPTRLSANRTLCGIDNEKILSFPSTACD
jgi:hypothetical protein